MQTQSEARILGVDGLRGLAVCWVLIEHVGRSLHLQPGTYVYEFVNRGGFGVTVFFVVSGFVITRLLLRNNAVVEWSTIGRFWRARVLRLMPAFLTYLATLGILERLGIVRVPVMELLWSGLGVWNYRGLMPKGEASEAGWYLGHTWSLSLEQQFYALWPIVLCFAKSLRKLGTLMIIVIVLEPVIRVAAYFLHTEARGFIGIMFHTRVDSILMGCLLALYGPHWRVRGTWSKWLPLSAYAALVYGILLAPWLGLVLRGFPLPFGFSLDSLVGVVLVVYAVIVSPGWLTRGPFLWLGRISYSLYLWQQLFLGDTAITRLFGWFGALIASLLMGWLSYQFVERPVHRWRAGP